MSWWVFNGFASLGRLSAYALSRQAAIAVIADIQATVTTVGKPTHAVEFRMAELNFCRRFSVITKFESSQCETKSGPVRAAASFLFRKRRQIATDKNLIHTELNFTHKVKKYYGRHQSEK